MLAAHSAAAGFGSSYKPVHEPEAREQDGGVDAFLVEHPQPLDRITSAGALDPAGRDMGLRSARQAERRPPRLAFDEVDDAAVRVALEPRREVAQRRIDVLDDPREVFLDVAVGVDDTVTRMSSRGAFVLM